MSKEPIKLPTLLYVLLGWIIGQIFVLYIRLLQIVEALKLHAK